MKNVFSVLDKSLNLLTETARILQPLAKSSLNLGNAVLNYAINKESKFETYGAVLAQVDRVKDSIYLISQKLKNLII